MPKTPSFINPAIDCLYRLENDAETIVASGISLTFNGKEITIPARYVARDATIKAIVVSGGEETAVAFDDWTLTKVSRGNDDDLSSFMATYRSETANRFKYAPDMSIEIEVVPTLVGAVDSLTFHYTTINEKDQFWKQIAFWDSGIGFQRVE